MVIVALRSPFRRTLRQIAKIAPNHLTSFTPVDGTSVHRNFQFWLAMLIDGRYSAWFRIPGSEGVGVITLDGGRLTGNDTRIAYRGSYVQNGDTFTASVSTRRHVPGATSILGIDELDIEMVGTSKERTAACKGIVKQRPDVPFDVVLVRIEG